MEDLAVVLCYENPAFYNDKSFLFDQSRVRTRGLDWFYIIESDS